MVQLIIFVLIISIIVRSIEQTAASIMKTVDSRNKTKVFQHSLRPSQSLHTRFVRPKLSDSSKDASKRFIEQLTVCVLYGKKKIQFGIKARSSFQELERALYSHFYTYLLRECQNQPEKAVKIIKTVVGFESADGDVSFDYRLTLKKGVIEKTKFFYPLFKRTETSSLPFRIYNCLAIGGFSKVYLARSLQDGQFYVIKFIKKVQDQGGLQDRDKLESMKNQVEVCNDLDHPFLVKMVQAFETQHFYCLVFEYCPGGELFFLLKRVKIMSETMAKFYFLQILYGMQYLHSKSIIYRDLKPENILIDADGNCKIVDFGLSKRMDSRTKTYSYCGSAEYMAPEMILRTGHSFGVDYYSLGAFLYELVTGLPPFYTKNHEQLQESIICQELFFPPHIELSNDIKDLLEKLLKKEEKYRLGSYIGVKEILFHPWMGKVNASEILGKNCKSPWVPNLREYNFDSTELGDDEEEFTALVRVDCSGKNCIHQEYISSKARSHELDQYLSEIMVKVDQEQKENKPQPKSDSTFDFRKQKSRQRLRDLFKSPRLNRLERIDHKGVKENMNPSVQGRKEKMNISVEGRKAKQLMRLSPYLNCKQVSPKKQKELMSFIENRILKVERGPPKALRRVKIQPNRICPE